MAGYMTKLQGYVYEGELLNGTGAAVENGMIVTAGLVSGELKMKFAATTDVKLLLKEKTTLYDGIEAYRFIVTAAPAGFYFVENGFEVDASAAYDTTLYSTPDGELLRAHPLLVGEEFVTDKVTGTLAVGTEYGVKADGTIG